MAMVKKLGLWAMPNEAVSDRVPFLGTGNLTLELVNLGRGAKREGGRYSYLTFKVLESDTAAHQPEHLVTKWIADSSFSAQKDIKTAVSAILNIPATDLDMAEVAPLFYDATLNEPEPGERIVGQATGKLAGRKVKVAGKFTKKKDGTMGTFPNHDWFPLDTPLD